MHSVLPGGQVIVMVCSEYCRLYLYSIGNFIGKVIDYVTTVHDEVLDIIPKVIPPLLDMQLNLVI